MKQTEYICCKSFRDVGIRDVETYLDSKLRINQIVLCSVLDTL